MENKKHKKLYSLMFASFASAMFISNVPGANAAATIYDPPTLDNSGIGVASGYTLTSVSETSGPNIVNIPIYDAINKTVQDRYYRIDYKGSEQGINWETERQIITDKNFQDYVYYSKNVISAQNGAAVRFEGAKVNRFAGDFISNVSEDGYGGGALSVKESTVNQIIGDYIANTADIENGGAINSAVSTISNITSNFINNTAHQHGGAIFSRDSNITEINANFTGNRAMLGGALFTQGKNVIGTVNGDFINNVAEGNTLADSNAVQGNGGAIYNGNNDKCTIDTINANFINNVAGNDTNGGSAGAVYNTNKGTINTLSGDFISNHSKDSGGAIYNRGTIGNIGGYFKENYVERNTAAGGAINNLGIIETIEADFDGNYTTGSGSGNGYGGAISNTSSSAKITSINGTFTGNSANVGGAIANYTSAKIGSIEGSFTGNHTLNSGLGNGYGGAIHNNGTIDSIVADFTDNYGLNRGGAIENQNGTINSVVGDFIGNHSTNEGGAIDNAGSGIIKNITGNFLRNYSLTDRKGGAISTTGTIKIVSTADRGTNFTGNYTKNGSNAPVSNAIFGTASNAKVYFDANPANHIVVNDALKGTNSKIYINSEGGTGVVEFNNAVTSYTTYLQGGTLSLGTHLYTAEESPELAGQLGIGSLPNLTVSGASTLSTINSEIRAASVGNLTLNGDMNWTFDVDLLGTATDTISASSLHSNSNQIIIDAINFLTDSNSYETQVILTTNTGYTDLFTLSDAIATTAIPGIDYYYYVKYSNFGNWTDGSASGLDPSKGILVFTRAKNTLALQVHNDVANKIYNMTEPENVEEDLGLLHGTSLIVNGDNKAINGSSHIGVILGDGVTQSYTVNDVTSYNGFISGAITNKSDGTLTVSNSTFESNTDAAHDTYVPTGGGAIYNVGHVTIDNSEFTSNGTESYGGAIYFNNNAGYAQISNSTIDGNFSALGGGGIYGGNYIITDTNVVNNITSGNGGGIGDSGYDIEKEGSAAENNIRTINIFAKDNDVLFSNNIANATLSSGSTLLNPIVEDGNYNDLYSIGSVYLNANENKSITFNGSVIVEDIGAANSGYLYLDADNTDNINGGTYVFNNDVNVANLVINNGANLKFGSFEQADGSTSYGNLAVTNFTNDANGGLLDLGNNHIDSFNLGNVTLNSILNAVLDITATEIDHFTVADGSTGTISVTLSDVTAPTLGTNYQVIYGDNNNVVISLASDVPDYVDTQSEPGIDPVTAIMNWGAVTGEYTQEVSDTYHFEVVNNNSLAYVVDPSQHHVGDKVFTNYYDVLHRLNILETTSDREFNASSATEIYKVGANIDAEKGEAITGLGTTSRGKLTINGIIDGDNISTIDGNGKTLFELTLAKDGDTNTQVIINNTKIKNAQKVATVGSDNELTLNNVTISGNTAGITNDGKLVLTGVNTIANAIDNVNGGTTYITSGETTLSANLTQNSLQISGNVSLINNAQINATLTNSGDITNTNGTINTSDGINNGSISGGNLNIEGSFENYGIFNNTNIDIDDNSELLYVTDGNNGTFNSSLTGGGAFNKIGDTLTVTGNQSGFDGTVNINEGSLIFTQGTGNSFFDSDAVINIDNTTDSDSELVYNANDNTFTFSDSTFAHVNLIGEGNNVVISGKGAGASEYTLNSDWLTSNEYTNNLTFKNSNYVLNTTFEKASGDAKDNINFDSSVITIGDSIPATDSSLYADAKNYNLGSNIYNLTNSTLDLINNTAGDDYKFSELNFTGDNNKISLDVNLYLDSQTMPYADTITADAGDGIVKITKLFITADNGMFTPEGDKGIIRVFKGNNTLKVADSDNVDIMSWATNIYKYGVKSASSGAADGHEQDSIKISPKGISSTDTLRDLNQYQLASGGGVRGFSFIAKDGLQANNKYNIYRDLDTTSAQDFSIIGTNSSTGEKSVLSGELKPLEIPADDAGDLHDNGDGTWTYKGDIISGDYVHYNSETEIYLIDVAAFTTDTYGSMFEIVNKTDFNMTKVSVENAKRYAGDSIKDGSVIYANNSQATITLDNVDFKNNSVDAGNGGAVANVSSDSFALNNSVIANNTAQKNGGAIYNTSSGETTLENVTAYGNKSTTGLGGAIYTNANMSIADSVFGEDEEGNISLNEHYNGQNSAPNDIYIAGSDTVLTFNTSENNTSKINSGLAGDGKFLKTGAGTLEINGSNNDLTGTFSIAAGKVKYTADDANDTFVNGNIQIASGSELTLDISDDQNIQTQNINGISDYNNQGTTSNASVIKTGAGVLNLGGDSSGFKGSMNIKAGSLVYTADDANDRYISGNTVIGNNGANANLTLDIGEGIANQTIKNITSATASPNTKETITKTGLGSVTLSGDNSGFYGTTTIKKGDLVYSTASTTDKYFSGNTVIESDGVLETQVAYAINDVAVTGQTIGNISGEGSFIINNEYSDADHQGRIQLIGNNDFSGDTDIKSGTLAYANNNGDFVSGDIEIEEDGTLEYSANANATISNKLTGDGVFNKEGTKTLTLASDASGFDGSTNINSGTLAFSNDSGKFVNGEVYIDESATLQYAAVASDDEISNTVSGSGTLNKLGDKALRFDEGGNNSFDGTVYINGGSLLVAGADNATSLQYNTVINNGIFDYTVGSGSNMTIGGDDSKVIFAENAVGSAKFNGLGAAQTTFNLDEMEGLNNNTTVSISNATVQLLNDDYSNGKYSVKDVIFDLIDDATKEKTFTNLSVGENTKIKIDVDLNPISSENPASDTFNVTNGTGVLQIALSEIRLHNEKNNGDDGLHTSYEFDVITGSSGLTLSKTDSIQKWSTNVYEYDVDVNEETGTGIILTKVKAADKNSLKAMNKFEGTRGFEFTSEDGNPYVIGSDLDETAAGSFVVNGLTDGSTVISGSDTYSFFDVDNDTDVDLSVNDVTITQATGSDGSVLNADSANANIALSNVNLVSNNSAGDGGAINNAKSESLYMTNSNLSGNNAGGNGGAINNTSDGTTILNNVNASDNTSGGLGGAIYTNNDMTITDSDFGIDESGNPAYNSDSSGKNDIYVDGATVTLNSATKDSTVNSGIAGDGNINKTGSKDLNLSGNNENFTGNLNVQNGNVTFSQNEESDTYISGNTNIGSGSTVTLNNDLKDISPAGTFSGGGNLVKDGSKNVTLNGDNSGLTGDVTINNGAIVYNPDDGTKYFSGKTRINGSGGNNGSLIVNTDNGTSISKVEGDGTIAKQGSGALVLAGNNSGFNGNLDVQDGSLIFAQGSLIGNINNAAFADGTSFDLRNTSVVKDAAGNYSTDPNPASIESLKFRNLTLNGDVNLKIDVDLKNSLADKIKADNVRGNGKFILGSGSLNVVSDSLLKNTKVRIADGALASGNWITLEDSAKTVMGPIQKYDVTYGGGNLSFTRQGGVDPDIDSVNPSIMASSVAAQVGGFLTQSQMLHDGFFHLERYMKYNSAERKAAEMNNQYAINAVPVYNSAPLPEVSSAMWVKPYTTFERVNLKGGLGVSNIAYGALYGGDSNMYDLGHGYKGIVSVFVGYNGSHQEYRTIDMNQQGGALGLTGTLYKGNFFTALTASAGASAGEAYTEFGTDHFAMLTSGIASKTGYNWELAHGKFIIQPSLFLGYTFVNTFDYTNAAGVRIKSDPLNTIQIAPSLKVIGNLKNGWQPYAGVDMIWNVMGRTDVMANDVHLPQLSVRPYVQYGLGLQKTWGDRFTGFFQTMIRNGGRNGVVLQAGFRWTVGKDNNTKTKVDNSVKNIGSKSNSQVSKTVKAHNLSNKVNKKAGFWSNLFNKMNGSSEVVKSTYGERKVIKSSARNI